MKKILLLSILALLPFSGLAYSSTSADRDWLEHIEEKISDMYPVNVKTLVKAYDMLDEKKIAIKITGGDRGLYLLEEMKKILSKQLFAQSDVCIPSHAQVGDTVEMTYRVYGEQGGLVRATTNPYAFTLGSPHVWKSLSVGAYGLKKGGWDIRDVHTTGVIPEGGEREKKSFDKDKIFSTAVDVKVGEEFIFGTPEVDAAIVGKVVAIEDDLVVFDFEDAQAGGKISIYTHIRALMKGCD